MRTLDTSLTERDVYRNDSDIQLDIQLSRGNIIIDNETSDNMSNQMVEGEHIIDRKTIASTGDKYRPVVKIKGKLYALNIDANNNIYYEVI